MQRLLSFYDFSVLTAKDYKTFSEKFESSRPGIVIIDVLLAGADGRQICKKLREDPQNKGVTLILFSASPKHLENFERYGADGIIEKPFGIKDIIEKINAAEQSRKEYLANNR